MHYDDLVDLLVKKIKNLDYVKEFQQADKELKIVVEKMQENLSDCRRMDVIQELYDKLECMIRICGKTAYCQGFHDANRLFNL